MTVKAWIILIVIFLIGLFWPSIRYEKKKCN